MVVADRPRVVLSQPTPCGQQAMRSTFLQSKGGNGLPKHRKEEPRINSAALELRSRQLSRRPSARGLMPPPTDYYDEFKLDYRSVEITAIICLQLVKCSLASYGIKFMVKCFSLMALFKPCMHWSSGCSI